jgi:DNA end-binding protein Ku
MILNTMYFDDEVGEAPVVSDEKPADQEMQLAKTIIDNMTGKFNPKDYRDEYREKVLAAIDSKIKGREITVPQEVNQVKVINLMDALQKTLKAM